MKRFEASEPCLQTTRWKIYANDFYFRLKCALEKEFFYSPVDFADTSFTRIGVITVNMLCTKGTIYEMLSEATTILSWARIDRLLC